MKMSKFEIETECFERLFKELSSSEVVKRQVELTGSLVTSFDKYVKKQTKIVEEVADFEKNVLDQMDFHQVYKTLKGINNKAIVLRAIPRNMYDIPELMELNNEFVEYMKATFGKKAPLHLEFSSHPYAKIYASQYEYEGFFYTKATKSDLWFILNKLSDFVCHIKVALNGKYALV